MTARATNARVLRNARGTLLKLDPYAAGARGRRRIRITDMDGTGYLDLTEDAARWLALALASTLLEELTTERRAVRRVRVRRKAVAR